MIINALGRDWSWPDQDEECRKVVFDWSTDLKWVYKYCKNFRTVIQAGGNMGVWPWLLAKQFQWVHTFEPDPRLHPHLKTNLEDVGNVSVYRCGLWEKPGSCVIRDEKANNLGAQYIAHIAEPDHFEIPLQTIDGMIWPYCNIDLIYLDIEGAELGALKGAAAIIARHKPTIVVEDKGLSEKFGSKRGDIAKFLEPLGYKQAARVHRDSIFVCG